MRFSGNEYIEFRDGKIYVHDFSSGKVTCRPQNKKEDGQVKFREAILDADLSRQQQAETPLVA